MRLYVENHKGERVFLNLKAHSKKELFHKIGNRKFVVQGRVYDINNVKAVDESDNTLSGTIVGGLIGLFGGPVGILIGALGGGIIGNNMTTSESGMVEEFNSTRF